MNIVTLYIKDTYGAYKRVDLFKDETISVTSKIKDFKDISKIFTDFSQSFTLPASKTNNKIFAHFEDYNIVGNVDGSGVFDPRKMADAYIEINYIPFREGKVALNGVKLKNNKAHTYKITFFGNTVNLKDLFKDDKLQVLDFLNNFSHEWTNTNVKNGIQSGLDFTVDSVLKEDAIIYPLITPVKRLFYDSNPTEGGSHDLSGNIYAHTTHTHTDTGLAYTDLKPAVKVEFILEAIERRYGIQFTDDFFNSLPIVGDGGNKGLYLWLSREKGTIGSAGGDLEDILNTFTYSSGDSFSEYYKVPEWDDYGGKTDSLLRFETVESNFAQDFSRWINNQYIFELTVTPSTSDEYSIKVVDANDNDKIMHEFDSISGTNTFNYETKIGEEKNRAYYILITSQASLVASMSLKIKEKKYYFNRTGYVELNGTKESVYNAASISPINTIRPTERVPEIKIYDFLSGIFKMFNLVAYYVTDRGDADYGKVKVMALNDFYNDNPVTYNISEYVDASETEVDTTVLYNDIKFLFEEPKTLLALQHKETFNETFGDSTYIPQNVDRGEKYEIKLPFAKMKYERLIDDYTGDSTNIQWGYSAGDNFKPDADANPPSADYDSVLTKPLLFFTTQITTPTNGHIAWITDPSYTAITSHHRPSNSFESGGIQNASFLAVGTSTSTSEFQLIDTGSTNPFLAVVAGDLVINTTTSDLSIVTEVVSTTVLNLREDIFTSGDNYQVLRIPRFTLNFDIEVDEWSRQNYGSDTNSLFNKFYSDYVVDVFNPRKRLFKVKAHLPNRILLNYRLNDRFQIGDKYFTINSITTNLQTGESNLELLNVL